MKIIVISPPDTIPHEMERIVSLFENGLEIFHIHKPHFSEKEIQQYIAQVPIQYKNQLFLHNDFSKYHSLAEARESIQHKNEAYFFLSPVFNSISKQGYLSNYDLKELKLFLQENTPPLSKEKKAAIFALGGIEEDKIALCHDLGFDGVAVLGAIWMSNHPVEQFKRLLFVCNSLVGTTG